MTPTGPSDTTPFRRRSFLKKWFTWSLTVAVATLSYPLLRFTGFTAPKKPRYLNIKGPLPLSGVHVERDFILFDNNDTPQAVSRTCTHLGCRVSFLEDKGYIECPCHQSRFTTQGKLINGPADKDLPIYAVEKRKDTSGSTWEYIVTIV